MPTVTLYPNADGYYKQLFMWPSLPATHYDKVDDAPHDSDTTYLNHMGLGLPMRYDTFLKAACGIPEGATITAVRVVLTNRGNIFVGDIAGSICCRLRKNTTDKTSSTVSITWSTYTETTFSYATSPFTGLAWTISEIDAMEFGLGMQGRYDPETEESGEVRDTQVRLEIDYTIPAVAEIVHGDGITFVTT